MSAGANIFTRYQVGCERGRERESGLRWVPVILSHMTMLGVTPAALAVL
jgi:hypothetical protein